MFDDQGVTTGFDMAMEESEIADGIHAAELIGYLAISPGSGEWSSRTLIAGQTPNSVTQSWYTLSYGTSVDQPLFAASIGTYNGGDPVELRYQNLGSSSVEIFAEEDITVDAEVEHIEEVVHYLVLSGDVTTVLEGAPYAAARQYYYAGSSCVAMRTIVENDDHLQFILTDHLGSTTTIVEEDGSLASRAGYMPWGGNRYQANGQPQSVICPQGVRAQVISGRSQDRFLAYFSTTDCDRCSFAVQCPTKPLKRRSRRALRFSKQDVRVAQRRQLTAQARASGQNLRAAVEATVRSVKHPFRNRKVPVRGQPRVRMLLIASAAMTNVRRIWRYWSAKKTKENQRIAQDISTDISVFHFLTFIPHFFSPLLTRMYGFHPLAN